MRLPTLARLWLVAAVQAATAVLVIGWLPAPAVATLFDDIGYTQLQSELGASIPTGAGISVSQIEVGWNAYSPDTTLSAFSGKTFKLKSGFSSISSHATTVATDFYGNPGSIAPGITNINLWESDHWASSTGMLRTGTNSAPQAETQKIENSSWVQSTLGSTAMDVDALRRFDYVINTNKVVAVVAANNGSSTTLPDLLMQSYNSISVGLSSGNHSAGYTTIDGAGRIKPDIVVPATATSFATPIVSGAAAVLLQKASSAGMVDASNPEVIKSILMGGATTSQLPGWSRSPTQPLDLVYGAGQLNVDNSYHILTAGEQHASLNSVVTPQGWDYNTTNAGNQYYFINVPANTALSAFSALLTWNRSITDSDPSPSVFSPQSTLATLSLKLFSANGFNIGSLIDSSVSQVDNVQRVAFNGADTVLRAGRYAIQVTSSTAGTPYALSWTNTSLLLGDMNADGSVNNFDIDPFSMMLIDPADYPAMYPGSTNYFARADISGDGRVDNFDMAPFVSLLAGGGGSPVPEPSSIVLMGLGGITLLIGGHLRRRQLSQPR